MPIAVVTTRLWLLGQGIAQSPSPAMHNAALHACGLPWTYSIHDVSPAELPEALAALRRGEVAGANVTIPHKRAVAQACDELVGDAMATGAANTVVVQDGRLLGHNTDALGFERALRHDGLWPAARASALILGAGGAAAAVVLALSRAEITTQVAARNPAAAEKLAGSVAWDADAIARAEPSLLINATPAPLHDLPVDLAALPANCAVVDLRYHYPPDDLVPSARARGLRAADGLEMLLQQAMLSFELWTARPAPIDAARSALHAVVSTR